jgi:hypothetical protein
VPVVCLWIATHAVRVARVLPLCKQQGACAQAVRWTVYLEIACQIVVMLGLLE